MAELIILGLVCGFALVVGTLSLPIVYLMHRLDGGEKGFFKFIWNL